MGDLLARLRSFCAGLQRSDQFAAEMDEEMRFHLDMEAERLVRERGLDPVEARRQAAVAFGGRERFEEEGRDVRGLTPAIGVPLDLRLGLRMLGRYPGASFIAGLGLSLAIGISAGVFAALGVIANPDLPLPGGDRIVVIENVDAAAVRSAPATQLHDLDVWRDALSAVGEFGAYRTVPRNLFDADGSSEPRLIAEISASGFQISGIAPLLGRHLVPADEKDGAAAVVVIGHDVWQGRFGGRPDVVGQTLQLGADRHAVVGVMPQRFGFPVNNHLRVPLRLDALDFARGEAPPLQVFGRLAPGATLEAARTQAETIGVRIAAPTRGEPPLRTRVLPYAQAFLDAPEMLWALQLIRVAIALLVVLMAANAAILVYVRTATRTGEIAVRIALGASRARVVAQFLLEALVLAAIAAAGGFGRRSRAARRYPWGPGPDPRHAAHAANGSAGARPAAQLPPPSSLDSREKIPVAERFRDVPVAAGSPDELLIPLHGQCGSAITGMARIAASASSNGRPVRAVVWPPLAAGRRPLRRPAPVPKAQAGAGRAARTPVHPFTQARSAARRTSTSEA